MKRIVNVILVLLAAFVVALVYIIGFNPELINLQTASYTNWFTYSGLIALCSAMLFLAIILYQKAGIFQKGENPDNPDSVSRENLFSGLNGLIKFGAGSMLVLLLVGVAAVSVIPHFGEEMNKGYNGNLMLFTILGFVIGLTIYALMVKDWWNRMDPKRVAEVKKEQAYVEKLEKETGEKYGKRSIWEKIFQVKPLYTDVDVAMGHDYDGIEELDNPPPPWFMALFYGTIAFAVFYFFYYMVTDAGMTQEQEYVAELHEAELAHQKYLETAQDLVDESNVELITDAILLQEGADIFKTKCVACHNANAEGGIGPNLTDQYWKNGGGIKNVFTTIKYGIQGTSMKAWSELSASEIHKVSSYVLSLQGTNPANAKAAEGEIWVDPTAAEGSDSTVVEEVATESTVIEE